MQMEGELSLFSSRSDSNHSRPPYSLARDNLTSPPTFVLWKSHESPNQFILGITVAKITCHLSPGRCELCQFRRNESLNGQVKHNIQLIYFAGLQI